jgi:non-canonical purine NTP pyrophosphatase (RdgB/HAM1 family)
VLATHNPGKLAEFRRLLGPVVELLSLDDLGVGADLPEPGTTYAENARAKAEEALALTGLPALADDSGIEVPGLGDWPGPSSARWLGDAATDRDRLLGLLDEVERRCPGDRRARYVAAVALAVPGAETVVHHGSCAGVLVAPRGEAGFGYDPAFLSDDLGTTFGEAADAAKDGVSHRGRALRALLDSGALRRLPRNVRGSGSVE